MAQSTELSLWIAIFVVVCFFKTHLVVDCHILVYRNSTNQLIEEYDDMPAQFGPTLISSGIKVYPIPVENDHYACTNISKPPTTFYPKNSKFAAIIRRGGINCTFELKVRNAQAAFFDAVVVYNNENEDLEHMSAKNSSGIYIPSVFVGYTTGRILITLFDSKDVFVVINDELPFNINTQLILPFSILIGLCFLVMIFYMIYKCVREERRLRRHRLPKRMLKKLTIIKFAKNSDLGYDTCVICLEEFTEGDKLRVLPCKHPYHSVCIDVWLTEIKRDCPICKRKVFTKGETRSQQNRQSSLDSITDTDDDTTPLLQQHQSSNTLINSSVSSLGSTRVPTRNYGIFRQSDRNNTEANNGGDIASDDENMLLPAQRMNPFDRSPNLSPQQAQLNNGSRNNLAGFWSIFRWLRRPTTISVVAPPYLEDVIPQHDTERNFASTIASVNDAITINSSLRTTHSSNNVLNPNLSGSFKDSEDDDDAVQCLYEPIAAPTTRVSTFNQRSNTATEPDTTFLQTPTQGGIAIAALPPYNNSINNNISTTRNRFW